MRPSLLVLLLAGLFITPLAGCAEPAADPVGSEPDGESAAPASYPGRYRVSGTVLENGEHGPRLCRGEAPDSLLPQCGGLDIVGWSWDGLDHEDQAETRWGSFEIVATFDGERLTLVEPPQSPTIQRPSPKPNLITPCPPPPGGWRVVDEAKATVNAYKEAALLADAAPGAAGNWIDQNGGTNDPRRLVLNVRFTGDLAAPEARLRAIWGGALCVSHAARSTVELNRIAAELSVVPGILSARVALPTNQVVADVYVASDARRAEVEARYGPGVVMLTGWLQPA
ncbi:hypothetical protein Ais01nite_21980 [Asanoa ishikariensis]|uniref:Uncharacterized protein n=1 Tax=Asanoa ishikariensis TaxID=137265 RepID=A0A1H3U6Z6_9ACTN|nr:hypothetical protein [Asanoa ishikariensis]GIF64163.1 hypothetical protein Ais01nite_21980 [Asanoa ishikariensis]SDZ58254.1 hypothetical protein SAMN05421684_6679 [Asanoa ishikariensis]